MYNNIRLGRGIIKEIDPMLREIEQILKNIEKSVDDTIETARKYYPGLF